MPAATFDLLETLKSVEISGHQQYEGLEIFHLRWATNGNGLPISRWMKLWRISRLRSANLRRTAWCRKSRSSTGPTEWSS